MAMMNLYDLQAGIEPVVEIAHDGYWDGMGATCPTRTVFVSGGGYMPADDIWYSGPDFDYDTGALIPNSWIAIGELRAERPQHP